MNERSANIENERLFLICPLPEEIESLVAGDFKHTYLLIGVSFPPSDANLGVDWS